MNVGRTSWLYQLCVVGGIVGIVAYGVSEGLAAEPGDTRLLKELATIVAIWVAGLIGLQAVAVFTDRWGGELDRFNRGVFASIAAMALAVVAGAVLYVNGADGALAPFGAEGAKLPYVFVPAVLLVLFGAARTPARIRRARVLTDEWLAGTGLSVRSLPQSRILPTGSGGLRHTVSGPTVLGGTRHGREVSVTLTSRGSVVDVDGVRVERRGGAGTTAWMADLEEAERRAGAAEVATG